MMEATRTCHSCGENVDPELRFCVACGTELGAPDQEKTVIDIEPAPAKPKAASVPPGGPKEPRSPGNERVKQRIRQVQEDPANQEFVDALKGYATLPGVKAAVQAAGFGLIGTLIAGLALAILVPESSFLSLKGEVDDGPGLLTKLLVYASGLSLAGLESQLGSGTDQQTFSWQQLPLIFAAIPLVAVGYGVVREFPKSLTQESQQGLFIWGLAAGAFFAVAMAILVLLGASWESGDTEVGAPLGKTFLFALIWGCLGGLGGVTYLLGKRGVSIDIPRLGRVKEFAPLIVPALKTFAVTLVVFSLIGSAIWTVQSVRGAADARGDRSMAAAVFDNVVYGGDLGVRNLGLASNATLEVGNEAPPYLPGFAAFVSPAETPIPIYRGGLEDGAFFGEGRDRLPELTREADSNGEGTVEVTIFAFSEVLGAAFLPLLVVFIGLAALLAVYSGFLTARVQVARSTGEAVIRGAIVGPIWALLIVVINSFSETVAFGELSSESAFIALLLGGAIFGGLGGLLSSSQTARAKQ